MPRSTPLGQTEPRAADAGEDWRSAAQSLASASGAATEPAGHQETVVSPRPIVRLDLGPEAMSDAAIASALGGGGPPPAGQCESELPIDAQDEPTSKPTVRLELDPEAVSDAAIASALGGADPPPTGQSELPIDAEQENVPTGDELRQSLGISTLEPSETLNTPATAEVAEARQGDEVAAPVCIVAQDGDKLCVNPDGMALLQSLESVPVAVIAVAGLYRTGKSFFMNQLAGAKPRKKQPASGFRVGHDTESCTRGVWVWLAPVDAWTHPSYPTARLLLMDTEGLASIDQDETWDAKIFSLGILLSSIFVYNSMGVIDEGAIDRLFLVGGKIAILSRYVCSPSR